jgi:hypothetical protein
LHSRSADDEEALRWPLTHEEALRPDGRRLSDVLNGPQMRSMRLIGNSNPRYHWRQYWKTEEELRKMKKPMCVAVLLISRGLVALSDDLISDSSR